MIRNMLIAFAAGTLVAPALTQAAEIEIESDGPVIELSVYESVTAEPDIVTIGAGVTTEAASAVDALRENSEQMQAVIDRIKALGVADEDIQTTGINLNPRYDYDRTSQRQVFRAYQVSNRVSVKLREIEETGAALDALVSAGATDLTGPVFAIEDDEAAKDQARERALERAREHVEAYAELLGFDEVRILEINEALQGVGVAQPMVMRSLAVDEAAPAAPPVQPGRVSTGVSITLKYELRKDEPNEAE
ncbi:MAG: SIMPL domain-containing protein [Pseudomonadota bacterium]